MGSGGLAVPERLETDRLVLRVPQPGDGPAFGEAVRASVDELAPWLRWVHTRKRLRDLDDFDSHVASLIERHHGDIEWTWFLWTEEDERLIGEINLITTHWKQDRAVEYYIWIRTDAAGGGFASEASHAVFEMLFDGLGCAFVEARVDTRNFRSRRSLRTMGFDFRGTLKDTDRLVLFPYPWARACHARTLRALRATDHPRDGELELPKLDSHPDRPK